MTAPRPEPAPEARRLALAVCRRIGANPDGPVGLRLIETCGALPPNALRKAQTDRDGAIARLIDAATNRETYFFRDRRQLALLGDLLSERLRGSAVPAAIWSAGCATGEEAYSLAIVLRQAHDSAGLGGNTGAVTGTDVSQAALAIARAAVYRTGPMSPCRDIGAAEERWLPAVDDGRRRVAEGVRTAVRFAEHNILSGPPEAAPFDAVVCRNVLIYMDEAARMAALTALDAALRPGGVLLLGPGDAAPPVDPVARGYRSVCRDGACAFVKGGGADAG